MAAQFTRDPVVEAERDAQALKFTAELSVPVFVAAVADDDAILQADARITRAIRVLNDRVKAITHTAAGKPRSRALTPVESADLYAIDQQLAAATDKATALAPTVESARERQLAAHMRKYAIDSVRRDFDQAITRLTRMLEEVTRYRDDCIANAEAGHVESALRRLSEAQRAFTYAANNSGLESTATDVLKAAGLTIR